MPEVFHAPNEKTTAKVVATATPKKHVRKSKKENIEEAERFSTILRESAQAGTAMGAYCPKPTGVSFEIQHEDEPVLLLLRQHPIVNVRWILIALFLGCIPILFASLPFLDFLPGRFQLVANFAWYAILSGFVVENFLLWFFNLYIITDERVIDVDFYNLLFKKISEAKLENIEDISSSTGGFLQSMLDYGQVRIQTAAEIPQIEFDNIPHPGKVAKFLSEMLLQEEQEKIEGRVR